MASLKDMRVRIASTKATQKITKAMQMVAASKLRRAQTAAEAARPYAERMDAVISNIAGAAAGSPGAPALLAGTGNDRCICCWSAPANAACAARSIRRSCGWPANTRCSLINQGKEVKFFCVGRKGFEQLRRNFEKQIVENVELRSVRQLGFVNAEDIAKKVIARFEAGEFDVCTLFYSRFKSVIAQIPTAQQIIPLVVEAQCRECRPGDIIRIRAGRRRDSEQSLAAQSRGPDLPRAAGKQRLVLRRADERDGQRHPQRRRHDPQADPDLQPNPSGDDHQGADRNHLRRRGDSDEPRRSFEIRIRRREFSWLHPPIRPDASRRSSAPSSTCSSKAICRPF